MDRKSVLGSLILLFAVGCSVKENREECPCRLILDFSNVDTAVVKKVNICAEASDGFVFRDTLCAAEFERGYFRDVDKTVLRLNIWGGNSLDKGLHIPYGCECPPLYMHSFQADTRCEVFRENVMMKKNHCRLTVLLDGKEEMPYCLTFRGNVDGYDMDGLPSDGMFSCVAYPDGEGGSQVVIPRQTDSSLLLDVEDKSVSISRTFAVGEYILASGYDWAADQLEDVTVVLDYYLTDMKIIYKGWDKEYIYDIIL